MKSLFYEQLGQGPPIMILPGLLGRTDNWRSIAQQLTPYYTIYLVDHRNHGRSFHSDVMTYEAMAADVCRLTTQLSLSDLVLIGHSMGSKVAMQFAQTYPQLLSKLIVIDMAPRAYDMDRLANLLQILQQTPLQEANSRTAINQHLSQPIPDPLMRAHCMKNLRRNDDGRLIWSSNIPVLADSIPHLEQAVNFQEPFKKPTLFVKGAQSDYIQSSDHALIQTMFPHYVLEEILEAGHWVHYDQPRTVLQALTKWL